MTEPEEPILPDDEAVEAVEPVDRIEVVEAAEVAGTVADPEAVAFVETEATIETIETLATVETVEVAGAMEAPETDEEDEDNEVGALPPPPAAQALTGTPKPAPGKGPRPDLIDRRDPLYRECKGYRLRLDPPDLARLRELAGSRGKSDDEIGEAFFDGQAERLAAAIADDVPAPSEIRVVVDPYSRQAFLALENRIRGILSF